MEPLTYCDSLLHLHYEASGFPMASSWAIAYSVCYSTTADVSRPGRETSEVRGKRRWPVTQGCPGVCSE